MSRSQLLVGSFLVALGVSSHVASAQFSGVKYLDISENVTTAGFSLAEVRAFSSLDGTGTNSALDTNLGDVSAETEFSGYGTAPTNAIDGNTAGSYAVSPNNIAHELDGRQGILDTFTVTFDSLVTVGSIELFGRTDCCQDRDNNIQVTLRDAAGGVLFDTATGIPDADQHLLIAVPEPGTFALLGIGAASLLARRHRR